jgi:hypothetical protein
MILSLFQPSSFLLTSRNNEQVSKKERKEREGERKKKHANKNNPYEYKPVLFGYKQLPVKVVTFGFPSFDADLLTRCEHTPESSAAGELDDRFP